MTKTNIPKNVLVICLGNICRSPTAEYLLRNMAQKSTNTIIQKINFDSAGIIGGSGSMYHYSKKFLRERNIEPDGFRSKGLGQVDLSSFDLIITMEDYMKKDLLSEVNSKDKTEVAQRIFTLKQLIGKSGDIFDPYGSDWPIYKNLLEEIEKYCLKLIEIWQE